MITTNVFSKNLAAYNRGIRRIINHGGQGSSKNYSILQLLLVIAQKKKILATVMSETLPHLKKGAILDFNNILKGEKMYDENNINKTDYQYFFGESVIEFISADTPGKVTGPRRDILYANECINMPFNIVDEAARRTADTIFYDYNPNHPFWIQDKVFTLPDSERIIIKSNHLDNDLLPEGERRDIISRAAMDSNFRRVHIDLEFGVSEGLIFPDINLVDNMPMSNRQSFGIDFGYSVDPTTLMQVKIQDGQLWINELLYQNGMTNPEIAQFVKDEMLQREEIIADSSEPKSIEELRRMGLNIKPAAKGADSIRQGIDFIKRYPINITKRSVNTIKEFRNYKWKTDINSDLQNVPVDLYNHCIDGIRYACESLNKKKLTSKFAY